MGLRSVLGGGPAFDPHHEFVPANLSEPGGVLDEHDVLAGRAHVAFRRLTADLSRSGRCRTRRSTTTWRA
jgi:hypothetical protein